VYAYDQGGNIQSKTAYAYTTGTVGTAVKTDSYTYGDTNWKDKLTAYNGTAISYDAIGNRTSDGTWTYTWAKGRQLQKMVKSGETVTFAYNADGLRVRKVSTSMGTTIYTLRCKEIVRVTNAAYNLHIFYDAQNRPAVIRYNAQNYGYVYNLQGDVIAIIDSAGTKVVEYKYDAWGRILSKTGSMAATLGTYNPFRYRHYVYDEETALYYLEKRYYNSLLSRFVNEDVVNTGTVGQTFGCNLYTYCYNRPIVFGDYTGCIPKFLSEVIGWFHENIVQPIVNFVDNVIEDVKNYDPANQSEKVVFEANYFSAYKGTLVLKTSLEKSGSFGIIVLSRKHQQPNVLKHEYGHRVQLEQKGLVKYTFEVAVPSLTINYLANKNKLPYDYYSYPWEAEANKLGGAKLSNSRLPPLPDDGYTSYWDLFALLLD